MNVKDTIVNYFTKIRSTKNNTIIKYKVFTTSALFAKWQKDNITLKVLEARPLVLTTMHPSSDQAVKTSTYIYGVHVTYEEPLVK